MNIIKTVKTAVCNLLLSLREVFKRVRYWVIAILVSASLFTLMIWLPNHALIGYILKTTGFEFGQKLKILFYSFGSFQTNFTLGNQISIVVVSFLAGVNIALLVFYMKKRAALQRSAGVSVLGMFVGLFGIGCSACGSVLITTLFGLGAVGGIIGFLPLHGLEFGLSSILIMFASIVYVAHRLQTGTVCALPTKQSKSKQNSYEKN